MGLYKRFEDSLGEIALVAHVRTYTMYQRAGGLWYVNFRHEGRQYRLSTRLTDYEKAKALVESHRGNRVAGEPATVNEQHLYRMIERARYKMRKKGIPMSLGVSDLREIVARCKGYCEVSGRILEDTGPFRPSLDRIVPKLGYVPGNVRIVCLVTNTAMLHYGEAAFAEIAIAYCRRIGLLAEPAEGPGPGPSSHP